MKIGIGGSTMLRVRAAARRFGLVIWLCGFYLALGAALRFTLWLVFGLKAGMAWSQGASVLSIGLLNDWIESVYLLAPLTLYTALLPERFYRSRWNGRVLTAGFGLTILVFLYLGPVEYYFFAEFSSRFNIVATDYLIFPHEVFNDIWTAYPVGKVLTAAVALTVGILWLARRVARNTQEITCDFRLRLSAALIYSATLGCLAFFVNTSSFVHGQDRVRNQIAVNGHAQFFEALRTGDIEYRTYYRSIDPTQSFQLLNTQLETLGGQPKNRLSGHIDRLFASNPNGLGKMNVIVVMEESLGAEFSLALGGKKDLTPHLDTYGKEGLWFTRMYAQGTRTVRGLEAITSSFPPIPTVSVVRRPNNANIATWGKVMRAAGYTSSFLYGGYGYFDNMNGYFASNGYEVVDRTSIKNARFENIWGVSDEDLFDAALAHFDTKAKTGKPFFAQIMTTSNHKPFTFRAGLDGIPERGGGREAGVRYADFSLDYFLKQAKNHDWFQNTLFVVVADHGARVYGASQIPLRSYEIPCLVWAPGHLKAQVVDELSSQIDIAPTVLALLGLPYQAPFFGRDILADTPGAPIMLFSHNHDVGLFDGDQLLVLGMQKQVWNYRYTRAGDSLKPVARNPVLESLAIAYYQTASQLFREHRYE